jgi:hypothetical protein
LEIVLTPRKAFHARIIYSDTFENSTNSSTHQGTFMSEEFKIMPTEGSTIIVTLAAEIASLANQIKAALLSALDESKYHCWGSPNDPSNNTSNYDIFKTTESFPLNIWDSRISDFPLKNAPCKNAHPLSLPPFELHFSSFQVLCSHGPYFLLSSCLLPSSQLLTSQSSSGTGDELTGVPKDVQ